jgi:hypothetical protein
MVKCTNIECPLKDKCQRFVGRDLPVHQEYRLFEYVPVKDKDGKIVGYSCQFQIFT